VSGAGKDGRRDPHGETPEPIPATLTADELDAAEIPDSEMGGGASGPMVGSFAATAGIQVMQAVTGVLLARVLGPSGRGELAAVILWPTVLTVVGSLGLAQASTYFIARARSVGEEGRLVGTALALTAAISTVLVAIGLIIVPLALGGYEPEVVDTARKFLVAFIPINLFAVITMSLLNGQHRFALFQTVRILVIAAILVGLVGLDLAGELTIESGAAAYVVAYAIGGAIGGFAILRSVRGRIGVAVEQARELLGFGLRSALSQSMWSLNERADQLVISIFFSAASLGLYVVAVTLTSLTTLIGFSFAVIVLPMIARFDSIEERRRVAHLFITATLVCATVVSVPIFVLEPQLIRFFFGADFVDAAGVGRVLLVAGIVFGLNRVMESILQAVGRPLESSIGEGVALAVTAAGLAVLLPTMGIMGAGVTSLIAYTASSAFMIHRAARALEVRPLDLVKPEREMLAKARGLIGSLRRSAR